MDGAPKALLKKEEPEEQDLYQEMKGLEKQLEFVELQEEYLKDEMRHLQRELLRAFRQATPQRVQAEANAKAIFEQEQKVAQTANQEATRRAARELRNIREAEGTAYSSLARVGFGRILENSLKETSSPSSF